MVAAWDEVIESHYLETVEGLFFAVKGIVHPEDRRLAVLRYAPDPLGERARQGQRYHRLYHFAEQEACLREHCPHYLQYDPASQLVLQSVPRECVLRVHDPRARLAELRQARHTITQAIANTDSLIAGLLALAQLLIDESGVGWDALGVSGSLLIGLHTPASDLDLTAYGRAEGGRVAVALHRLLARSRHGELRALDSHGMAELYRERTLDTEMAFDDFLAAEQRKVNQGTFRGRPYFLRFVLRPQEVGERYGDLCSAPAGRASIVGRVTGAEEAIFTPCRYAMADVRTTSGDALPELREIISFRGRFCEQAGAGDWVRACGALEQVQSQGGERWQRMVLGAARTDMMVRSKESEAGLG